MVLSKTFQSCFNQQTFHRVKTSMFSNLSLLTEKTMMGERIAKGLHIELGGGRGAKLKKITESCDCGVVARSDT